MYYSYPQEVFQEVPGEISLALSISGCPLRCKECHSSQTHDAYFGILLDTSELEALLKRYKHISCVLFYGGEWEMHSLLNLITIIKNKGLKVALYSGFELSYFNKKILDRLDFIKTGPFRKKLGGLDSSATNQKFYILKNGKVEKDITNSFVKS